MRLALAALCLALLAGCGGGSPPNAGAPTPTVAISMLPSAAPAPPAPAVAKEDEPEPAGPPDCESQLNEARSGPHATMDDCAELGQKLYQIYTTCSEETAMGARTWAALGSADCVEDVMTERETKLLSTYPPATRAKLEAASQKLKGEISSYCTRECPMDWSANCTVGMLQCKDTVYQHAQAATLTLDPPRKLGRSIHVFDDQAAAVCALPNSAWKNGAPPPGCLDKALSMIESCVNPGDTCADP